MNLLSTTLIVLIDDVPGNMEMEIIDLQCSGGRKKIQKFWALGFIFQTYWHEHFSSNSFIRRENGFRLWN